MCEEYKRKHVVSDDYADCKVESLDVCEGQANCPKVSKTTCSIITKNVTKEFPENQVFHKLVSWLVRDIFHKYEI